MNSWTYTDWLKYLEANLALPEGVSEEYKQGFLESRSKTAGVLAKSAKILEQAESKKLKKLEQEALDLEQDILQKRRRLADIPETAQDYLKRNCDHSGGKDSCWPWIGGFDKDNYGAFSHPGTTEQVASRASYRLYRGDIPEGMFVCHSCDNPTCVNPKHIFLGTHQDNMDDMVAKGRSMAGSKNFQAKLSEEEVLKIKGAMDLGLTNMQICRLLDNKTSLHTLKRIRNGEGWIHILDPSNQRKTIDESSQKYEDGISGASAVENFLQNSPSFD